MSEDVVIRDVRRSELPEVVRLCQEHAAHEGLAFDEVDKVERLELLLFTETSRLELRVIERDTQLVGYLSFAAEVSTWEAAEFLHLDCLYLRPAARRQGIGRAVFALLEAEARARGLATLQWQTPPSNESARLFYERMGASALQKLRFSRFVPPAPETV